eukprot:scaffold175818_cov16-Tisochrysis_lutea.AAC.1
MGLKTHICTLVDRTYSKDKHVDMLPSKCMECLGRQCRVSQVLPCQKAKESKIIGMHGHQSFWRAPSNHT